MTLLLKPQYELYLLFQNVIWFHSGLLDISQASEFSNVVAFGHNKLWRLVAANSLFMTLKMLWTSAITIYGGRWLQMANLASLSTAVLS